MNKQPTPTNSPPSTILRRKLEKPEATTAATTNGGCCLRCPKLLMKLICLWLQSFLIQTIISADRVISGRRWKCKRWWWWRGGGKDMQQQRDNQRAQEYTKAEHNHSLSSHSFNSGHPSLAALTVLSHFENQKRFQQSSRIHWRSNQRSVHYRHSK